MRLFGSVWFRPEAAAVNVRYVGALSRNEDRMPVAQKNCHGWSIPS
jgi:hypothetical protein